MNRKVRANSGHIYMLEFVYIAISEAAMVMDHASSTFVAYKSATLREVPFWIGPQSVAPSITLQLWAYERDVGTFGKNKVTKGAEVSENQHVPILQIAHNAVMEIFSEHKTVSMGFSTCSTSIHPIEH
ncbi:predicted protein [Histoplasma capsulatum H143]|uniref:Uncharacterized protein n=1 Tax=Ajellomyces capsulatus (strain H143) TaxID=544712 RepID=C6HJH8_AJECH|nr:predicted protein [Histoplasma capsulatum H143]